MAVLDLAAYKPVPATLGDANQIANGFTAIQACINALDNNNFAAGKIFDPLKLMQDGATAGQGLVWSAAANGGTGGWVPGTVGGLGGNVTVSTMAGGPPGSPADKDIWVATAVDGTNGVRWVFQYNAGAATYKWEFIGGAPVIRGDQNSKQNTVDGTWECLTNAPRFTLARAGQYRYRHGMFWTGNNSNTSYQTVGSNAAANLINNNYIQLNLGSSLGANFSWMAATIQDDIVSGNTRSAAEVVALVNQSSSHTNLSFVTQYLEITPIHVI